MDTTPATPRQRRHISALEGLRGVAVIGVLLFHDGRLAGGFLGVDLFFALSGFLITGLLIDERVRTGAIRLGQFWVRRARRLLPALLAIAIAIVPLMYVFGSPGQLQAAREGALPALVYWSNWQQILQGSDYWALFSDPSPMTHLWSLAVEGQFYILWPLAVYGISRLPHWRRWLGWCTAIAIGASVAAIVVLYDPLDINRAYIGTDTRVSGILLGALVAILAVPAHADRLAALHPRRMAVASEALHVALVVGLGWSWFAIDGQGSGLYRGGLFAHSAAGALLVGTIGLARPTVVQRVLSWRALTAVGAISYSLYLWHWPAYLVLTSSRTGWHGLPLSLLRWAVSAAAATASLWLIESPIRHRRWIVRTPHVLTALTVSVAAVVLAVVAVPTPDTTPAAFDPDSVTLPSTTLPSTTPATTPATTGPGTGTGDTTGDTRPATTTTQPATTTTIPRRTIRSVMWEGDSVAFDAAPGVVAALAAAGLEAHEYTYVGSALSAPSPEVALQAFGDPIKELQPDVVVFQLSGWDAYHPRDQQLIGFNAYTELVASTGAVLVFVTPPPIDPEKGTVDIEYVLSLARERAAERPDQVMVVDSAALWGPFSYDPNGDGVPERKVDGVHVCPQGSALMGAWLVQTLAAMFDGVTPAPPGDWAGGAWVNDERYNKPVGSCA